MAKQIYGSDVFDLAKIKEAIGVDAFHKFEKFIDGDEELDEATAEILADAFMEWAIAKGATRFTHWFQPMTGMTAEKHDAFLEFAGIKSDIASFFCEVVNKRGTRCIEFSFGRT